MPFPPGRLRSLALAIALVGVPFSLSAQTDHPAVGSWSGKLDIGGGNQLTIVFHIELAEDGALGGTMDSPDQAAFGIPLTTVTFDDGTLTAAAAIPGAPTVTGAISEDGATWSGTFSQGGGQLPIVLTRAEGTPEAPRRPQEPEPPYPYAVEEVSFENAEAGIRLAGTLTVPPGDGPFPGAVLVSGSGPQDRDESLMGHKPFWVLADHLTRAGIAVLRYDDRGVGESEGEFVTATSEDFVSDALAAVDFLAGRAEVRADGVGIVGHSEGGLVGPRAAQRSETVDYVVMLAGPGVPGLEILVEQGRLINRASATPEEITQLNVAIQTRLAEIAAQETDREAAAPLMRAAIQEEIEKLSPEFRALAGDALGEQMIETTVRQMNSAWMRHFLHYDPRPALEAVRVPVLALLGEKDLQVPHGQNAGEIEAALQRGGNADATVLVLPGLNHLFQEAETGTPGEYQRIEQTFSPNAMTIVSDWIQMRFGAFPGKRP